VQLRLFAATSARDTDWTAKLVDIAPDGYARNVTAGIVRARYRSSFERPALLEPAKPHEFTIDLGHTSNVFLRGHRIRLEVSSSSFPRYSRNTNTGNLPELDASFIRAEQTVYHDRARPSQLILSVRP
jgi:putative CocE/NonD family hydrolase